MASPLHKVPIGLLELFRLRTLGRAPDSFGDQVLPTVDILEAYAAAEMQSAASAASVGAINGAAGLIANSSIGTFQWLWGLAGQIVIGAAPGTYIEWEVGLSVPVTSSSVTLGSGRSQITVAGQIIGFGITLPKALIARAQTTWFARVHGDGAGVDHSLDARVLHVPAANLN